MSEVGKRRCQPSKMLFPAVCRAVVMSNKKIHFVHHQPTLRNIGDDLCSPRHYFDFSGNHCEVAIVGGGVFEDFGLKSLARLGVRASDAVLWGAGRSLKRGSKSLDKVTSLPHAVWGIRDIDGVADAAHFLPCVSCLHPMLDHAIPDVGRTLLFLNADPRVTMPADAKELNALGAGRGWDFLQNNCSDQEMSLALQRSDRLITNSFHGAYWGLLSGRRVQLMGYSSKFDSLLKALDLEPKHVLRYDKPRKLRAWNFLSFRQPPLTLSDCVSTLASDAAWLHLNNAPEVLNRFRQLNLKFAERLVKRQMFGQVAPASLLMSGLG